MRHRPSSITPNTDALSKLFAVLPPYLWSFVSSAALRRDQFDDQRGCKTASKIHSAHRISISLCSSALLEVCPAVMHDVESLLPSSPSSPPFDCCVAAVAAADGAAAAAIVVVVVNLIVVSLLPLPLCSSDRHSSLVLNN